MKKIDLVLVVWCVVSVIFWGGYWLVSGQFIPFVVYFPLWLGIVGSLTWRYRADIESRLQRWRANRFAKFVVLGFAMVFFEEIFAALANHLREEFSPAVYLARIGQFWALNFFTFAGFIVGWFLLSKYIRFTRREVFYLAGIWGLFAEKIIFALVTNPAFFVFTAVPIVFTYGLIIAPAMLSQWSEINDTYRRRLHPAVKYPLVYALIFVCSLLPILILMTLREQWPFLFPPPEMVPL